MKIKGVFSILKIICPTKRTGRCVFPKNIDISGYRHRPNVAPFSLDLSPRMLKDSDSFIRQDLKNVEYARKVNYQYN